MFECANHFSHRGLFQSKMTGLAINGGHSAIAQALRTDWIGTHDWVMTVPRGDDMPLSGVTRYLFCQGLLRTKRGAEQSDAEAAEGMHVNFTWIANQCDRILDANMHARICVIGSESGFAGSFDDVYADAKRRLHGYVESKGLHSQHQQLVAVAPSIIADAGMTLRRTDQDNLLRRLREQPKARFILATEVAGLIHHLLYVDTGQISGVTIRMNGGAHVYARPGTKTL